MNAAGCHVTQTLSILCNIKRYFRIYFIRAWGFTHSTLLSYSRIFNLKELTCYQRSRCQQNHSLQ